MIATHPRSTSTALERAFLTRSDVACIHEPFGEPFYYGPERLSDRYSDSECDSSQYKNSTFESVQSEIESAATSKSLKSAVVVKDMAQYIIPPVESTMAGKSDIVAKSFASKSNTNDSISNSNPPNPTLLPASFLASINYVFLIRPPHLSIPSYYKCCIPPQSKETGFDHYRSSEAGYRELRILYDYITELAKTNTSIKRPIVIDSLDLMANPVPIMARLCDQASIPFTKDMLSWGENPEYEVQMFEKWKGFHNDALNSTGFQNSAVPSNIQEFKVDYPAWEKKWMERFNDQNIVDDVKKSVEEHLDDYLYLRQFKVSE